MFWPVRELAKRALYNAYIATTEVFSSSLLN